MAGLNIGADDYIYKPYTIRNVLTRVNTVLRRVNGNPENEKVSENVVVIENMIIDNTSKTIAIDGEEIKMPKKEFEILNLLASNPGRVFSRDEIIAKVWEDNVIVVDRVVDVNITRLRKKLGNIGNKIITRSGYGYGLEL